MRRRRAARKEALAARLAIAQRDCGRIIAHVAREHRPRRIYQWGSLVHTDRFSEISDIDIGLEGLDGGETALSAIRDAAEKMTEFHVDLVVMERVEAGRAALIRRFGRIAWESPGDG